MDAMNRNIALPSEPHGGSTQVRQGVDYDQDGDDTIGASHPGGAVDTAQVAGSGRRRHVRGAPSEDWTQPAVPSTGEPAIP